MVISVKLLMCKKCSSPSGSVASLSQNNIYRFLHEVQCMKCKSNWLVCTIHDKRFTPRKYYLAKRHLRDEPHSFENLDVNKNQTLNSNHVFAVGKNDEVAYENNVIDDISIDNDCNSFASITTNSCNEIITKFISSERNINCKDYNNFMKRYIECESTSTGNGIKKIVGSAFSMNSNCDYSHITDKEAFYHLKSTLFSFSLTASQKNQFSDLSYMSEEIFHSPFDDSNNTLKTHPPSSSKDILRYYLTSVTSIAKNIPIPTVEVNEGHAVISIKEALQHFLSFESNIDGMLIEPISSSYKSIISSSSSITSSMMGNIIRSKVKSNISDSSVTPLIIYCIIWSDDFEPNNVKQHKKSTWIKTITFAPPQQCQTSPKYTYVIALGAKKRNHDLVNFYFKQELDELKSPTYMYCKATNSNIPIVVETLAISADRPERSALNCMLGHNGINSRRWRYSAYIKPDSTKSCSTCFVNRIDGLCGIYGTVPTTNNCRTCCDWNYNHPEMKKSKPKHYPESQHPNSPTPPIGREVENIENLYPIELTYDIIKAGIRFCFFNCYHDKWNKISALVYLKSIGVNAKYGDEYIYQVANQCRRIETIDESNIYDYIEYPVMWKSGITLDQCIDTPMHQIFQGIVKTVMEETILWLSKKVNSHYKVFGDKVNDTLQHIHDVGVDWCRMEKFTSGRAYSLGGWQAEQFLAFSRCVILIYSCIREIVTDKEIGIDEHECLIQALLCFISRVMSEEDLEENELLDYIKCFLSTCDLFENVAFKLTDVDPFWLKKGNFLSLLNLPSQIKKFGNIRYYWEGSRERSIQQIKPFLINIRSTASYYKTKLAQMYVSQTLKQMCDNTMLSNLSNELCEDKDMEYSKYSSFKVYSDKEDFQSGLEDRKIISAIVIGTESGDIMFNICQRKKGTNMIVLHEIIFGDSKGFNKCGSWYAPIKIRVTTNGRLFTKQQIDEMATDYALVCQCISSHDVLRECYCVLTKKWKYRSQAGFLLFPVLSHAMFVSTINKPPRSENIV